MVADSSAALSIENLHFSRRNHRVLNGIDACIEGACLLAVLGANGSGKSSLIKVLAGLYTPSAGRVLCHGQSPHAHPALLQGMGYMPEQVPLYAQLTVAEQLRLMANLKRCKPLDAAVTAVAESMDLGAVLGKPVGALSYGFRQRLGVAQALLGSPRWLLLDEPMNGMDPDSVATFKALMGQCKKDTMIVMSSHLIHDTEDIADRVLVFSQGQVKADVDWRAREHRTWLMRFLSPVSHELCQRLSARRGTDSHSLVVQSSQAQLPHKIALCTPDDGLCGVEPARAGRLHEVYQRAVQS